MRIDRGWCNECLQGVEEADHVRDTPWDFYKGTWVFHPCGHTASFYDAPVTLGP